MKVEVKSLDKILKNVRELNTTLAILKHDFLVNFNQALKESELIEYELENLLFLKDGGKMAQKEIEEFIEKAKHISEFQVSAVVEGERVDKDDIEDKEIVITNWVEVPSKFEGRENFLIIEAIDVEQKRKINFVGGTVIDKKLKQIGKENLPVKCRLVFTKGQKGRRYWDLV